MNCIFCDIVNGSLSAEILYEDDKILAFLDINPMNFGHTLIIPKQHYPDFLSVPEDELGDLIKGAHLMGTAIKESLKPDGVNVITNNGRAAGQSIFHFHFHVIPRFTNDEFKFKINLKKYSNGKQSEYAETIRHAVKK